MSLSYITENQQAFEQTYRAYDKQIEAYTQQINKLYQEDCFSLKELNKIISSLEELNKTINDLDDNQIFGYQKRELLPKIEKQQLRLMDYIDPPDEITKAYRKQIETCRQQFDEPGAYVSDDRETRRIYYGTLYGTLSELAEKINHDDRLPDYRQNKLVWDIKELESVVSDYIPD